MTEATHAGELLRDAGLRPDVVHTSLLRRAIRTAELALDAADLGWLPVRRSWRLNERHYGALQGLDKSATREKYGDDQFMRWRRSYDEPPPPLDDDSEWSQAGDPRYADLLETLPRTECLADVVHRMLPYWYDALVPGPAARPGRTGRRARQLAAGAGQAPRRAVRRGGGRAQHPDRHPAALRAGRADDAGQGRRRLPRPGRRRRVHRGGQEPGPLGGRGGQLRRLAVRDVPGRAAGRPPGAADVLRRAGAAGRAGALAGAVVVRGRRRRRRAHPAGQRRGVRLVGADAPDAGRRGPAGPVGASCSGAGCPRRCCWRRSG